MDSILAKLEYIIFENKDTHYMVGTFAQSDTYHLFTGAGRIVDPSEDQEYELTGQYVRHPKYGTQFKIESAKKILPTHQDQIIHFLSGESFPTIGKKTAEQIYELFGDNCLEMIKEDYSILYQIPKLTQKKIDVIKKGIEEFEGFDDVYIKLMKYGLDNYKIGLLQQEYKDKLLDVLEDNCFRPYYDIYGFGYKSALKLADGFNLDNSDERRLDAYIYETSRQLAMMTGNTFIILPSLIERCKGLSYEALEDSLDRLSVQKSIHVEDGKVYPFTLYDDELLIAKNLNDHIFEVENVDQDELERKIKEVEFSYAIEYDDVQKEAIRLFFEKSFFILNGGPGTGKTTTVKGILNICRSFYPDAIIQLCAPTGRASKRLAQLSNCDSRTIHSLLQWNKDDNSFGKDENDPLDVDFLIVDEFSMVDTHLFSQLFRALPARCRIMLIGDEDQLESVGPGKVFEDIIQSKVCPIIHLEKIFRQSNGSGIVSLASQIRKEEKCRYEDGVKFLELDALHIMDVLENLTKDADLENLQILAPMYKGVAGIDAINSKMQMLHNPESNSKRQFKVGTTIFRENDKVMLLKNLPDEDVYNGDMGTIVSIEKADKSGHVISVDFGNTIVDFSTDFLYYLTHAYCISVHKAQGSEYETVICIVEPSSSHMLEKRLLYTGISRAKKQLFLLGNQHLFESQVRLKQKRIRQTTLKQRILEYRDINDRF